jgi:multisubunit Na+/H+ antiporter MnhB subunit
MASVCLRADRSRTNGLTFLKRRIQRMHRRLQKLLIGWCLLGTCVMQGCIFNDPDVGLRASLAFGSDVAIFLLENLAAGL